MSDKRAILRGYEPPFQLELCVCLLTVLGSATALLILSLQG